METVEDLLHEGDGGVSVFVMQLEVIGKTFMIQKRVRYIDEPSVWIILKSHGNLRIQSVFRNVT